MTAHRHIEESGHNSGLGLTDDMKIQYFKAGIRESSGLENALENMSTVPDLRSNFLRNTLSTYENLYTVKILGKRH